LRIIIPLAPIVKSSANISDCKKFNNLISKIFGLIFRSDRKRASQGSGDIGSEKYAQEMAERNSKYRR